MLHKAEKIKVAKITNGKGQVFYIENEFRLERFSGVEVIEMSREEYNSIPATIEAREFFDCKVQNNQETPNE